MSWLSALALPALRLAFALRKVAPKLCLIDKSMNELGDGNVLMASGSSACRWEESKKRSAAELYEFVMSEGVAYPDLVRAWAATCGRAIDWLRGCGVGIDEKEPGRIWLDQESEISLAPVYKKDVGSRALAKPQAKIRADRRALHESHRGDFADPRTGAH